MAQQLSHLFSMNANRRLVSIETSEGKYTGVIQDVYNDNNKLTLNNVSLSMKGSSKTVKLPNTLNFEKSEVVGFEFLDQALHSYSVQQRSDNVYSIPDWWNEGVMQPHVTPSHLVAAQLESKELSDVDVLNLTKKSVECVAERISDVNRIGNRPPFTVFETIEDEQFSSALSDLKSSMVVCVAGFGINVSRDGLLSWLVLASVDKEAVKVKHVYIFDMMQICDELFISDNLGDLLTNDKYTKIMHDCRFLSDCLLHKYNIMIHNVWDTQVAKVIMFSRDNHGSLPRYVDSLNVLLQKCLSISKHDLPTMLWVRESHKIEDETLIWKKRPLPDGILNYLLDTVRHLPSLRAYLTDQLLSGFYDMCNQYVHWCASANDNTAMRMLNMRHLLPGALVYNCSDDDTRAEHCFASDCHLPVAESVGRLPHSQIRFTRDSWRYLYQNVHPGVADDNSVIP